MPQAMPTPSTSPTTAARVVFPTISAELVSIVRAMAPPVAPALESCTTKLLTVSTMGTKEMTISEAVSKTLPARARSLSPVA